jgi:phospholipid-translocating ATPase
MSRLFRRHPHPDDLDEDDNAIDDDLRLRTVRTAASTIAESIHTEIRAERRRKRSKRSRFLGLRDKKVSPSESDAAAPNVSDPVLLSGRPRRNIYINQPLPGHERNANGEPAVRYVRNKVRTSSES